MLGDGGVQSSSLLDSLLLAEWEDRMERGLFRYDVTACPTKVVPGAYGFIAQLNEGRGSKKRPTEFTADKVQSNTPSTDHPAVSQMHVKGLCGGWGLVREKSSLGGLPDEMLQTMMHRCS